MNIGQNDAGTNQLLGDSIAAVSSLLSGQCSSIGCQLCDYHFIGDKKTWKEAQEYCRKNHTDLARVSNEADMQRLRGSTTEQYQDGVWIGLQRDWCWSLPGVEFNESKWHQGQPNNEGNHEICVMMKDDTWDDDSCTKKYKFICYDGENMWRIESVLPKPTPPEVVCSSIILTYVYVCSGGAL
uniref:C-type lectin domain-containing protein n=1 Tax=Sander lucioperca TaxID=283035 RepID=A0A8D0CS07_SANLU